MVPADPSEGAMSDAVVATPSDPSPVAATKAPPVVMPSLIMPLGDVALGNLVTVSLMAVLALEVFQFGTSIATLFRAAARQDEMGASLFFFADGWETGLYLGLALAFPMTAVLWMVWQHRAHSNLIAMQPVEFRPATVWWWMIPVANLFFPYRAVAELARSGTDRPGLRRAWWAFFLAAVTGIPLLFRLPAQFGIVDVATSELMSLAASVAGIVAVVLATRVVRMIDVGIEAKRVAHGATAGPRPIRMRSLSLWATGALLLTGAGAITSGAMLPTLARNFLGVPTFESGVGTCFNESDPLSQGEGQAFGFPYSEVDCHEPHDGEVYAVINPPEQSRYPGGPALSEFAEPLCFSRFESYTGVPYNESPLDFGYIYPNAQSWVVGDREVVCFLFNPEGDLTAPVRDDGAA